ncbi:hypothetical protein KEM56_007539 [Ascosphaera pollenicola]|nr:hypothetical protein KEM56_007539 [Ascosphaera pollenicola]
MAFYNFPNVGQDFYDSETGSPLVFFDDSDDDYIYAVIDNDGERQRAVKRRRQVPPDNRRNANKRNQRTRSQKRLEDIEHRERPEKQNQLASDSSGTWFAPRFDVHETQDHYHLHGELPGVEQENVHLEFTDPRTIQVRGFVNRAYNDHNSVDNIGNIDDTSSSISNEFATGSDTSSDDESEASDDSPDTSHQATVEEVDEDGNIISIQRAKQPDSSQPVLDRTKGGKRSWTYWLTERSVGKFQRTFQFPRNVDQDNVKAKLWNGILNVTIPKEAKKQTRKITIE